jgi:Na+/H+-dicarboxylate symporter
MSILELLFGIIPENPIQPFLNGNTLQIVLLGILVGVSLLMTEQTGDLRKLTVQIQNMMLRCIRFVCMLLPLYIFSSLTIQFWTNGVRVFLQLWKPLLLSVVFGVAIITVYMIIVCKKFGVKLPVLLMKLMPDFLIGLTTASSSTALALSMEINEEKLGIDSSFSRMATPIGCLIFASDYSMSYILIGAYLAQTYNVETDLAWWISLGIMSVLLTMASPPVTGSTISCLMILMTQLDIPQEALSVGITLTMLLDFLCTSARIMILHMEMILQADRLSLLDRDVLMSK